MRGLPPTVRGTPQDGPVLRYAVQKGGGAPPRRNRPDGCHSKSTSISLSRGHPFAKIGGAYIATAMRSLGCHAKSSCRHRAGCTLAEYVAPCIPRWPTVRHGQPHKGAGRTTWAPISVVRFRMGRHRTDIRYPWSASVVTSVTLRRGAFALAVAARATPKAEFRSSDGIQEYARVARASLESREMVDSDAAGVAGAQLAQSASRKPPP